VEKEDAVRLLAALQALHVAAWGAYYAVTRMLYSSDQGFLLSLAAAETLPTAAGLLGGALASRRGYRPVIALGVAEGALLAAMGAAVPRREPLLLLSLAASTAWSIAGPQVYALALTLSQGSAEKLGLVLAGATLGYTLGAGAAPLAAEAAGAGPVLASAGLLSAASYAASAALADGHRPATGAGTRLPFREAALVAASAAACYVGAETLGSVYMGRLAAEAGPGLYSLANTAAGLAAAAARPLAGRLLDRYGPGVLPLSAALYALYSLLLDRLHGAAFVALWLLPLYPFLDMGLYGLAYARLGESLGSSVVSASYSLAGLVLAAAARLDVPGRLLAEAGFASAALLSLAALGEGRGAGGQAPPARRRPSE